MDLTNADHKPLVPAPELSAKSASKVKLFPEIEASLHRMAENLRTHDPDVAKGRYQPH